MSEKDPLGEKDPRPQYRPEPLDWAWGNRAFWTAALIVAAAALSTVRLVVLHEGGSVTFLSLLPLWLVSFFYGPRHGAIAGAAYGVVRLALVSAMGEWVNFAPGALLLEYPLACGAFAVGTLFCGRRVTEGEGDVAYDALGLRAGYFAGLLAMGACYVVSAMLFYPPDAAGFFPNLVACIVYDMSYLLMEGAATELLLCVPSVPDAIFYLRLVATTKKGDPTLDSF